MYKVEEIRTQLKSVCYIAEMKRLFLGLDCSTQSLSAVLIDFDAKQIIYEKQLIFQRDFAHYGTVSGTLREGNVIHSPPMMWVEALDRLFLEMTGEGVDLKGVLAISGSAQQHGSVYLNERFAGALPLLQMESVFSRKTAPIWMDASTTEECEEIQNAMGGMRAVIEATGSKPFERFTAAQVRKFYKQEPERYKKTQTIALVSSFMASLMSGRPAPIDYGDGSGMNLMDIRRKRWHEGALEATAPDLCKKLPELAESERVVGRVNPYFTKYGLNPEALSLVWTGDNPSSLIGLGLIEPGMTAISLGTSFTHFACLKDFHIDPTGEGHLFVSPTGDYMTLNCFLNGALAIQKMREHYGIDWKAFNRNLEMTKPGPGIMLPYFDAEIIPKVLDPRVVRQGIDESDAAANCRALVEAQAMSMRLHSDWMRLKPNQIYVTGGVSHNLPILQIVADVFNCPIVRSQVNKSTALGAGLRAAHAYFGNLSWKEVVQGFTDPIPAAMPHADGVKIYNELIKTYRDCEQAYLKP